VEEILELKRENIRLCDDQQDEEGVKRFKGGI